VDIHTHYDGQAVWDERLAPSSWHGVTTAVMGNCGVGFAPVRPADRQRLIELMEGVEDIPGAVLHEGLDWAWESFSQYLDVLQRRPRDIDLCAHLPHAALRVYVMGERAAQLQPATPEDIAQMRELAAQAIRAGAIGFSTSRSLNHRSLRGEPTPSLKAGADELMGIALGVAQGGAGVLQFISDFDTPSLEAEFAMLCDLVRASGLALSYSLAQTHREPQRWKTLLALTREAVRQGLPIRAQVAPRPVGVLLGLQGSRNPFSLCPSYRAIADLPLAQRLIRLREPAIRHAIICESADARPNDRIAQVFNAFDRMFALGDPPDYEPPPSQSVSALARRQARNPAELAYDMLLQDEGRNFLFAPFANYADGDLQACREMLADANTVMGLSDGGAHVSIISDASFPTYLLQHWGRDRADGRFDLGWLVRQQTLETARAVGLNDRGLLAPGMKADINVIDFDRLAVQRPVMHADLPAGGRRLLQKAHGYVATIVSGEVTYRDGQATGALPGQLVRHRQRDPRPS